MSFFWDARSGRRAGGMETNITLVEEEVALL